MKRPHPHGQENHDWGYDRIVGALANLGYQVCDQTVGNVLRGVLRDCRYLLHDRDSKYTQSFRAIIASGQVEALVLPARSPNLKTSERSLADRSTGGMGCKEGH
jgi:hypothetical protein